jgi:hypothetical protein
MGEKTSTAVYACQDNISGISVVCYWITTLPRTPPLEAGCDGNLAAILTLKQLVGPQSG